MRKARRNIMPGFGVSLGITISWLSLIVLVPLASLSLKSAELGPRGFWLAITDLRTLTACKVSLLCALAAALINTVSGLILAWVITRYRFPLRRLIDGLIELPFALPTAVAGISLTFLTTDKGWIGKPLHDLFGIRIAYTELGLVLAMTFVTIPFVVRSVQPVLEQLSRECEDAGLMLGAGPCRIFFQIILPEIRPALLTGFSLAFARGMGEYGSVIFIAGNIPFRTEIAPLMIMNKLEQFNYGQAVAVAMLMLVFSFSIMFFVNRMQARAALFAGGH
jgi:sulfate transport system permease protein